MNKLIVCNMKMNLNKLEIDSYLEKLKDKELSNVIFCPTALYIPYFIDNNLNVGIQNISRYEDGSHTGQISAKQAHSMNINYAILGHSETNNALIEINEKVKLCSKYNITPIICIGEEEITNDVESIIENQIDFILKDTNLDKVVIAYEPIWMIGTNNNNDIDLNKIVMFIKKVLKKFQINDTMILYGGSVNEKNIINILNNTDGVLLGNASIDIDHFFKILEVA